MDKALEQAKVQAKAQAKAQGGGGTVTLAEAEAMARAAVAEYRKVQSFATPPEGSTARGSRPSLAPSAQDSREQQRALKATVAEFYGLACGSPLELVDMLGVQRPCQEVELVHLWPAFCQDLGPYAKEMALPEGLHAMQRNFLLLPRDLHQAFASASVCFIPCSAGVRVRVLQAEGLSASLLALDGTLLQLPLAAAASPRVPYTRVLGWMAWLAKCKRTLAPLAEQGASPASTGGGH